MLRRSWALLLGATLALAQEETDDEGIAIDDAPPAGSVEPRTEPYPAREPGKKPAAVTIQRKVYSFVLPADWVMQEQDEEQAELSWDVLLPGSGERAALYLFRDENKADPRSAPHYAAEWLRKDKPGADAEVKTGPCPRLIVRTSNEGAKWIDGYFYLSVRNNPYVFQLSCAAADFAQAEEDLLAAVASFSARVEIWPPIPKGYEILQEGTWLVARAPSVTASLGPLTKCLKEQEKRFCRNHGPLPRNDAPIVVLVHGSTSEAAKLDPKAAGIDGFYPDVRRRRLFALPIAKGSLVQEGAVAAAANGVLLVAKYGDYRPDWIWSGSCTVARAEAHTGKPLPALDEGFVAWSTTKLHRLDELDSLYASDHDTWARECFFYVAALEAGKHKKAYEAFLKDFAETGDGGVAFARHLGTIDQEELRSSTSLFFTKLVKPVKRGK